MRDLAKRRTPYTPKNIQKLIKEGRGQGEGADYMPWLTAQDVPSIGRCTETKGWKSGRIHHLFSKLETKYLYQLEWTDSVVDIREQFPLLDEFNSYDETIEIANQIGVKHSIIPKTQTPNVMTTDFLITLDIDGEEVIKARSIKYAKDLDQRTREKLKVESLYWERRGVEWRVITEREINESLVYNVGQIYKCKTLLGREDITQDTIYYVEQLLLSGQSLTQKPLTHLTNPIDKTLGLCKGSALFIVKYLIANKFWIVDMNTKFMPSKPLALKKVALNRNRIQEEVV